MAIARVGELRVVGAREHRLFLLERAQAALGKSELLLEEARRQYARAAQLRASADLLHEELAMTMDVGREVRRLLREGREPVDGRRAILASERIDVPESMDLVLLRRFGNVAKVSGGLRAVATAIIDQPELFVVLADLTQPAPVEAGLLVRVFAPETAVLVVADDDEYSLSAAEAGLRACRSTIEPRDLEGLLSEIAA